MRAGPARPRRPRFGLFLAGLLIAAWAPLAAHTPDTSYARADIGRSEVAFTFTFDFATLNRIAPLDTDRDGHVSRAELAAVSSAVDGFVRRSIYLELNERIAAFGASSPLTWPVDAGDRIAAEDYAQRLAAITFRNSVLHAPDSVALTFDFFGTLGERHTILGNFVFEGRENPVIFSRFEPDYLFDTGYRVEPLEQFQQYFAVGLSHIFLGYDHIAFLLALLFVRRFRDLVKIITAFTVAHTITLAIAALGWVSLPSRLVESAIAASIVYVAAENIWRRSEALHRWRLTFAFGLVHGFGFAAVLRELGLPSDGLVRSLLAFNLGVEVGQLAIAAVCWPLLLWIAKRPWAERFRRGMSLVLLLFGAAWLIDRVLGLGRMPF